MSKRVDGTTNEQKKMAPQGNLTLRLHKESVRRIVVRSGIKTGRTTGYCSDTSGVTCDAC